MTYTRNSIFLLCSILIVIGFYLLSLLLSSQEHADIPFEKERWNVQETGKYPYRSQMVKDIVYNDTIRSLSQVEIVNLLGEPSRIVNEYYYYDVNRKRLGPWTVKAQSIVIKFIDQDTIEWIKIYA